jgi:hypothetical protein
MVVLGTTLPDMVATNFVLCSLGHILHLDNSYGFARLSRGLLAVIWGAAALIGSIIGYTTAGFMRLTAEILQNIRGASLENDWTPFQQIPLFEYL